MANYSPKKTAVYDVHPLYTPCTPSAFSSGWRKLDPIIHRVNPFTINDLRLTKERLR